MGYVRVGSAFVALLVGIGASKVAVAQSGDTAGEDGPKVQQIRAVERGGFVQMDVGLTYLVNKIDDRSYGLGMVVGFFGGYDVLPILNVGVGVTAIAAGVQVDDNTPPPVGDLLFVIPTLRVQFAVLTTERNFVWIRGDVGFGLGLPGQIDGADYGGNGLAGGIAVGFERFTKLRHFSIGGIVGANVVTKPAVGIGISVIPMVKYTF
ncbi:MAG: adventurous gliding motility protein CglE [Deltaproteobacteria bacterium]